MPDYSNTIIYKIYCKDENVKDFYVGATCNFIRRKNRHKSNCINKNGLMENNMPLYCFMRLNGGWDNWIMEKIQQVNCRDKRHRNRVEAKYIKELEATLNQLIPQDIEGGLDIKEYRKKYYENNKENVLEKRKEYCRNNKENVAESKKKYYQNNKEKINEKDKEYRKKNKEKIAEKRKEKYKCACGSILTKNHKLRHERTKKHQDYINRPAPNLIFEE